MELVFGALSHEESAALEVVRRWWTSGDGRLLSRMSYDEFIAEDIVYAPIKEWPESRPVRGRDAYFRWMQEYFETWPELSFAATSFRVTGNRVVNRIEFHASQGERPAVSGRAFVVSTVRDGQIVRQEDYQSSAEARAAAGLE